MEQVAQADIISENQQAYIDDYFDDKNFELVDDSGKPIDAATPPQASAPKTNAEAAKTNQQPQKQPNQTAPQPNPTATEAQQKPVPPAVPGQPQKLDIEAGFYDENGQLKDEAFDFFGIGKDGWNYEPQIDPELAKKNQEGAQQPEIPEWQKQVEERKVYRESLSNNYFAVTNRIEELVKAGYDPLQAIQYAKQEAQQSLQDHFSQREYEDQFNERKRFQEELARTSENQKIETLSMSNQSELANKVGGIEKYQQLMFSKEIGGPILNWLFDQLNPDKARLPKDQVAKEIGQWWAKFSSNKQNLNAVYEMAMSKLQKRIFPEMVKRTRSHAQAQVKQNAEGKMPAPGRLTAHKAAPAQSGDGLDDLDRYLNPSFQVDQV
jgi:hypothetical protein